MVLSLSMMSIRPPSSSRSTDLYRPIKQLAQRRVRALRVVAATAVATKGRTELQGLHDWTNLIRPDHQTKPRDIPDELRKHLIKKAELTQMTYDSFYGDAKDASTFGLNKFPPEAMIKEVLLNPKSPLHTYKVFRYIYAESGLPPLRTDFITGRKMNRYWQGFCAISEPGEAGPGKRDVVFAWRGTIAGSEWSMDVQNAMVDYDDDHDIGVAEGFSTMYMVSQKRTSPQVQVKSIMTDLWKEYGNEIGSISVVGHSLGGALAHLNAFHLGDQALNKGPDKNLVPITAYTFCSPRVGDTKFKEACDALDIKVLRTVNRRDIVPKVPGLSKDELEGRYVTNNDGEDGGSFRLLNGFDINDPKKGLKDAQERVMQKFRDQFQAAGTNVYRSIERRKSDQYDEVGTELMFDSEDFPDTFKKGGGLVGAAGRAHNLEALMHMIDPQRDPALCNKSEDALIESFNVPPAWFGIPMKGMRMNEDGFWKRAYDPFVEPEAEPEPIGQETIDEKEASTHGMRFPDMQGVQNTLHKLPGFGFGRKEAASKK